MEKFLDAVVEASETYTEDKTSFYIENRTKPGDIRTVRKMAHLEAIEERSRYMANFIANYFEYEGKTKMTFEEFMEAVQGVEQKRSY
jgi:hypothetical protein